MKSTEYQESLQETVKEFKKNSPVDKEVESHPLLMKLFSIGSDIDKLTDFLEKTGMTLHEFNYMNTEKFIKALEDYEGKKKKVKVPRMRRPETRTMLNDTFTNLLFNPDTLDTEELQISGNYKAYAKAKEVISYTILSEDNAALQDKRVYEYGRAVMDTMFTLFQDGTKIYTLASLYKAVIQDTSDTKVNNSQLKTLFECLRKLNTTWIETGGCTGTLIDVVMKNTENERVLFDNDTDLNKIIIGMSRPPLLSANYENQRITVDASLLKVHVLKKENDKLLLSDKLEQITPSRIAIKNYLLRNTNSIITGNMKNSKMLFDTILYNSIGEVTRDRSERKRHREYIETVLNNFVLKGFIRGFKPTKTGKGKNAKVTGYEIQK